MSYDYDDDILDDLLDSEVLKDWETCPVCHEGMETRVDVWAPDGATALAAHLHCPECGHDEAAKPIERSDA